MPPLLFLWITFSGLITLTFAATNSTNTTSDTYDIFKPATITKPGCNRTCGNLTVPYPFGIGSACALNKGFELNCTNEGAFIGKIQILDISDNHTRISNIIEPLCGDRSVKAYTALSDFNNTPFSYSELNKFTVVGCDKVVLFSGRGSTNITTGCFSQCDVREYFPSGVCSGRGCCQISMAKGMQNFLIAMGTLDNRTTNSSFDDCGHAFVGEKDRFQFRGEPDFSGIVPVAAQV